MYTSIDRARETLEAVLAEAIHGEPSPAETHEADCQMEQFATDVENKVAGFDALDCVEYVDLEDVDFDTANTLTQWRKQVAQKVIDNAKDGELWALEFLETHS